MQYKNKLCPSMTTNLKYKIYDMVIANLLNFQDGYLEVCNITLRLKRKNNKRQGFSLYHYKFPYKTYEKYTHLHLRHNINTFY